MLDGAAPVPRLRKKLRDPNASLHEIHACFLSQTRTNWDSACHEYWGRVPVLQDGITRGRPTSPWPGRRNCMVAAQQYLAVRSD